MLSDRQLNEKFTAAMFGIYDAARQLRPPYTPSEFRKMVSEHGGKGAADRLLSGSNPSSGFTELFMRGRENLRLSVEYLVLQEPWRRLFTSEQRAEARRRLQRVEFELPAEEAGVNDNEGARADDARTPPAGLERFADEPLAEEVSAEEYVEGAKRTVVINEYERSPEARSACIKHYGAVCSVCGFDFEKVYGQVAAGFIHVHHLAPVSSRMGEYVVDPVADLRPVCPNCHAVIHLGGACRPIEEVRAMLDGGYGSTVS